MKSKPALVIFSAIVYIAIGCFNNMHAWPLACSFVAGVVVMIMNKSSTKPVNYGRIVIYGLSGMLLVGVLTAGVLWFLSTRTIEPTLSSIRYIGGDNKNLHSAGSAIKITSSLFFLSYLAGTAVGALIAIGAKARLNA